MKHFVPSLRLCVLVLLISVCVKNVAQAQVQIDGSLDSSETLFVGDNSTVYFESGLYSFDSGYTITTRTKLNYGLISFDLGTWIDASESHFVDGYVQTVQDLPFIFPIGQSGIYAPIEVDPTSSAGVDAAYYRENPKTIGVNLDGLLAEVSSLEYWDIQSAGANASISLSWSAASAIATLTGSSLSKLTIVGWNGSKWVTIPSNIDQSSILGKNSDLDSGSIRSNAIVGLSSYTAFSLGTLAPVEAIPEFDKNEVLAFINNSVLSIESKAKITGVVIYDITGKIISSEKLNGELKYSKPFYYEEAIYVAKVEINNGASMAIKKLINRIK
jgi:hypothetical protein